MQRRFSDLETRQLPYATVGALNDAMFAVVRAWKHAIPTQFDRPVARTINAVGYTKATREHPFADVYVKGRFDIPTGTPPARYLVSEVTGGIRQEKPFEKALRDAGVLGADEFVVPARGFPLDPFGNVAGGIMNAILSDLGASQDPRNRSTPESRARRSRRKAVGKRAVYFASAPALSASQGQRQHLPRAIYQRTSFGKLGSAIRMVFIIVQGPPTYRSRLNAQRLAQEAFDANFKFAFAKRLDEGVRTARIR